MAAETHEGQMQCVSRYNRDLDAIEDELFIIALLVRTVSFIACALSVKWRKLSNYLIYFDCLERVVGSLVPTQSQAVRTSTSYAQEALVAFVMLYCNNKWHIIVQAATFAFTALVPQSFVYLVPVEIDSGILYVSLIPMVVLALTCLAMVIAYIRELHG